MCTSQGWALTGDIVFVANHDDSVKTRNIEKKQDFEQFEPILRAR
jgi:hypothetical protein